MALSDLSVCNLAIGRISGDPLDEVGEESPLGAYCNENYPQKRRYLLSKYRWTFANRVALLAGLAIADPATAPMSHRFARPADLVGAVHDYRDTANPVEKTRSIYVLDAGDLWADQPRVFAEYTRAVPEADMPAWFVELLVTAFAADLALFAQQRGLARDLNAQAWGTPGMDGEGGLYLTARNEDARMAPQRQLVSGVDAGPLVGARFAGGLGPFGHVGFQLLD